MSEIASPEARQRQLHFMARCLAVCERAVKWEREIRVGELALLIRDLPITALPIMALSGAGCSSHGLRPPYRLVLVEAVLE